MLLTDSILKMNIENSREKYFLIEGLLFNVKIY